MAAQVKQITGVSIDHYTFDAETELKDAGLVAATAVAQVDAANRQLDFGGTSPGPGVEQIARVPGLVVIDVDAIETDTADESYDIVLQLSDNTTFASGTVVSKPLVHLGTALGPDGDTMVGTGRLVVGVDNEFQGVVYRFARLVTVIAGTIATGINYRAFLTRND